MTGDGQARFIRPGVVALLGPKIRGRLNRARGGRGRAVRTLVLGTAAALFWFALYAVMVRVLLRVQGEAAFGDILAGQLLAMALLAFFLLLLLSNLITALSTFFLSKDLELLAASPADPLHVYGARLTESTANSSWMVGLLLVPVLAAYGSVYGAGLDFVLLTAVVLVPFLALPGVLGAGTALLLVNIFPARRTRDLLALVAIVAAAGVAVLLRMLRPERLTRPEEFRSLVDFMATMEAPAATWLPSEWAADVLISHLTGGFELFPLVLLGTTAAAAFVVGGWAHQRYFAGALSRAQEGRERKEGRRTFRAWERLLPVRTARARELVAKEIRVFFRDTSQWSQLILLGVLMVVYVYNVRVLPLATAEELSFVVVNGIAFLNLALAGFVVAAVAARFVFPAMSLEGGMFWLLRSSPLESRLLLHAKYWVATVPLVLVAVVLVVATNLLLGVSTFILVLSTATMLAVTFALSAMALAFGAVYPNYDTENPAEIPTSYGGLLFMMAAVTYLGAVVALQAWPVHRFLTARLEGMPVAEAGVTPLVGGVGGGLVLTGLTIVVSFRVALRQVDGDRA